VKRNKVCKRPEQQQLEKALGREITQQEAELILGQMELLCEIILEQIDNGQ
tara:strand:- start:1594 stop:1746 length:153 start_codon:yes stop_codon:yes gene_type:complete